MVQISVLGFVHSFHGCNDLFVWALRTQLCVLDFGDIPKVLEIISLIICTISSTFVSAALAMKIAFTH